MNVFVVIDTIHNISNLIPLMEKIDRNKDYVYILYFQKQSPSYQKLLDILRRKGIKNVKELEITDSGRIRSVSKNINVKDAHNLYFVINGGTKAECLQMYVGLQYLSKDWISLYNSTQPSIYYEGKIKDFTLQPKYYEKHGIDLKEILQLQGYSIYSIKEKSESKHPIIRYPQKGTSKIIPLSRKELEKEIRKFCDSMKDKLEEYVELKNPLRKALSLIFRENPDNSLGSKFEELVFQRILHLIYQSGEGKKYQKIVQSIWKNVAVTKSKESHNYQQEFDIIIVLKNGILLYIECKSGFVSQKDMDAKFNNLRRVSSLFSKMILCVPVFDFSKISKKMSLPYQNKIKELSKQAENHNYYFLPFTEELSICSKKTISISPDKKLNMFEKEMQKILDSWLIPDKNSSSCT